MKYILTFAFLLIVSILLGQSNDPEYWRAAGYQSKSRGELRTAILQYSKILIFDQDDYDARLALARLYQQVHSYDTAIIHFNSIFKNDSTDVEALNGLGNCYFSKGQLDTSIKYFQQSLAVLPDYAPTYFSLAKAYINQGRFDEAIQAYKRINDIDPTYSESWAGAGKMYYWKGMPLTASKYYEEAVKLDPGDAAIRKEYQEVLNELNWGMTFKSSLVKEEEDNYTIEAFVNTVKLEKRITDVFQLEANFLLDHSKRDYYNDIGDTSRWFDNSWVKGSFYLGSHRLSLYGGYSSSDEKATAYGLNWLFNTRIGKISVKNNLNAGYDYFYYWNQVGAKSVVENLQLSTGFLKINARYALGRVDPVLVKDIPNETTFVHQNDFNSWGVSLYCKVFSKPDISLGLNYSFLDYQYKSTRHYSPFGRKLSGASISIYYPLKKFYFYGSYNYNLGNEYNYEQKNVLYEKVNVTIDNWSGDLEFGYEFRHLSVSTGLSRFSNPYYNSMVGFVMARFMF